MKIIDYLYCWIISKWWTLMELFGLRISDDWFMWLAAEQEVGKDIADVIYTQGILLRAKFGSFPSNRRFKNICKYVNENKKGKYYGKEAQ